ncbi:lipid-A-disaccharide synthase [Mangrovivirga cuniculi]|uniref:Lipid-A-disaccharide synthase n=1 Tax=Mangrovivirga cuniculi TaxID=2715131 RepID=A0A4D7JN49_9BACT|nr:lipid-A-disaccharide synthase [Mangrovivirga cuniculi]QCK14122.1 lipid-A-disaccharide synthase [Mangrovivirga cuniculi]
MKYFLIAGERSGDMHAGNLIKALASIDNEAEFFGWGGNYMEDAGMDLLQHYQSISFMGFWEVIQNFRTIKKAIRKCKSDISSIKPDAIILVDFAGFNLRIAAFAKSLDIPVHYYISPKIWAWNTKRAYKIKKLVDHMYCILPFEVEFYKQFDYSTDYVGNPLFDQIRNFNPDKTFANQIKGEESQRIIALLPGSRYQEVSTMLDEMLDVIPEFPEATFVVAAVDNLPGELYSKVDKFDNVKLINGQTYDLLNVADAALVTSGTATLETALFNVPHLICYKAGKLSYLIAKQLIKVDYIGLPNLIAGKEVVPELIQEKMNSGEMIAGLKSIINGNRRKEMIDGFKEIKDILGNKKASLEAGKLIFSRLNSKN